MPLPTIFQLYRGIVSYSCIEYILPWVEFEFRTFVVMGYYNYFIWVMNEITHFILRKKNAKDDIL